MTNHRFQRRVEVCALVFILGASAFGFANEQVLYSMRGKPDGETSVASLALDAHGNLYGTTWYGGSSGMGTVFELSNSKAGWQETILHSFTGGADGAYPIAGLTIDKFGDLYGTALEGGLKCGCGVVFKLAHSHGVWTFHQVHAFNGSDGSNPSYGKLVLDRFGDVYGATQLGGSSGFGTIFKLSLSNNAWKETVVYNMTRTAIYPYGVIMYMGRLYGTATGGTNNLGSVFELSPELNGTWKYTTIFAFQGGNEGAYVSSGVIADPKGNLYGTTSEGGSSGLGLAFQLVRKGGIWRENVLHVFDYGDGAGPDSVVFDSRGNIFGETAGGDAGGNCAYPGCGVIFELVRGGGMWTCDLLHSFNGSDGSFPQGGLIIDGDGNLYGTTEVGGASNFGVVFKIQP